MLTRGVEHCHGCLGGGHGQAAKAARRSKPLWYHAVWYDRALRREPWDDFWKGAGGGDDLDDPGGRWRARLETPGQPKFPRQIREGEVRFLFARDGAEALEMLGTRSSVDMVVSDINMPRMDGLTLLEKIQEGDDPLSTVIVSAYGDMANIRTAMNRGAFDFLT